MVMQRSVIKGSRLPAARKEGASIPQGAREYQFQNVEHMERVIESYMGFLHRENDSRKEVMSATQDHFPSQFLVFSGVPSDVLEHKVSESSVIEKTYSSYYKQLGILVLKMVLRPHEQASRGFDKLLDDALRPMGLDNQLGLCGSARVYGPQRDKQPDCSYLPRILPAGRSTRWPSVVVETASSEGQHQVDADARWWLENSDGDVKVAITISIKRIGTRVITIRRWEGTDRPTRANPHREVAELMQEIKIVRQPDGSRNRMGTAPLRLPFEKVMLHHPATSIEADILIPGEELEALSSKVWDAQDI
ncbi:hypothetical protein AJ78_05502 [Emergomyces pasteurianus Ep9510]|uniref:Uncharacterized protein n=1 Tax=Emergomyces pasteurianus Ep9510 TaxID=1447872 RepID=A0A1J9QDB4_9EURO|nr:hypothetical protein AJ78_05502 [Emergomyces pasteurianus Ep9510]